LARPDQAEGLRRIWWRQGTSLGVREQRQQRWALPRSSRQLDTSLGSVRLKQAQLPSGERRSKAEFDDLAGLARRHGLSLAQVRQIVVQALAQEESLAQEMPLPKDEPLAKEVPLALEDPQP
jgi:uncharacterized protein (DUF111 family)